MTDRHKIQIIFATGNQGKIREIREIIRSAGNRAFQFEVLSMKEADAFADPEENGKDFEDNALIKAQAVYDLLRSRPVPMDTARIVMSDDSGLVIDALGGAPGVHSARYMGYDTDYRLRMEHLLDLMKDVPEEKRTARFVAAVAAILPGDCYGLLEGARSVLRGGMAGEAEKNATKDSVEAAAKADAGCGAKGLVDAAAKADAGCGAKGLVDAATKADAGFRLEDGEPSGEIRLVVRGAMEGRIAHGIAGENGFGYDPFFCLPQYGKTSAEISPEEKNRISHRGQALRSMLGRLGLLS